MIFVLKSIIFITLFLLIMFLTGRRCCSFLRIKESGWHVMVIGFVVNLAVIEIIGWPFMAFQWNNNIFRMLVLLLIILQVILGCWKLKISYRKLSYDEIIVFTVILIQIIITLFVYRSDADDSFYVSNVTLFQHSSVLNAFDSSFGIKGLGTVPMYDFQTWEAWIAVFCWLLKIDGASMMHTVMVPVLIVLSAAANIYLGRVLFEGRKSKGNLFYVFQVLFWMMGGYAVYSQGSFLLSRIWQGKAVYLHVVMPVMIALLLQSIKSRRKFLFAEAAACILAGVALNPTSLYVMGFQLIFMILVISIQKKAPRHFCHALPSVGIVMFYTVMIYLRARKFSGQIEAASSAGGSFIRDTFLNFWGEGLVYFILYLLAVVVVLIWGSRLAKCFLVYTPTALLLGVWNPWLGRIIAEKVTKVPSYWRVFWLIPVSAGIVYAIILAADKIKKKYIAVIIGVILLTVPGKWMFSKSNGFTWSNNVQRVPDEVLEFGSAISVQSDRAVVLGCDTFATTLRQVYNDVELIHSRPQYVLDLFQYRGKEQEAQERFKLMDFVNGASTDYTQIASLLEKYNVDYIVIRRNAAIEEYLNLIKWSPIQESGDYKMYRN